METRQADRITAALEEMILTGQFQEGERLDEAMLAKRFGVSRTPVREALAQLVSTRLARQVPRRGVFVRQHNSITLIEMFETMAEIEGVCTRISCERMTPEALELLIETNAKCQTAVEAEDAENYSRHNVEFHHLIYRMTGNRFLERQAIRLYTLLKPFRRVQFHMPGRMADSIAEHQAIIEALSARDGPLAERIARDHVATQGEGFYSQMAQLRRDTSLREAG